MLYQPTLFVLLSAPSAPSLPPTGSGEPIVPVFKHPNAYYNSAPIEMMGNAEEDEQEEEDKGQGMTMEYAF